MRPPDLRPVAGDPVQQKRFHFLPSGPAWPVAVPTRERVHQVPEIFTFNLQLEQTCMPFQEQQVTPLVPVNNRDERRTGDFSRAPPAPKLEPRRHVPFKPLVSTFS